VVSSVELRGRAITEGWPQQRAEAPLAPEPTRREYLVGERRATDNRGDALDTEPAVDREFVSAQTFSMRATQQRLQVQAAARDSGEVIVQGRFSELEVVDDRARRWRLAYVVGVAEAERPVGLRLRLRFSAHDQRNRGPAGPSAALTAAPTTLPE